MEEGIIISPVRNAKIQIFNSDNNLLTEGITNKKGIMKYLVNKNDSKNKNKPNNENNQSDIKHNEIYDTPPYVIRNKSIKKNIR